MVGRTVMMIVFVQPPAIAKAEYEIGMNEAEDFVSRGAAENFLMAGVVHDETELREDESQERGVAELDPGIVVEFGDEHEGTDEHDDVEKNFAEVIPGLLGEQAALPYESQ